MTGASGELLGFFIEDPSHVHTLLRPHVLSPFAIHTELRICEQTFSDCAHPDFVRELSRQLADEGIGAVQTEVLPADEEFAALGARFGYAQSEGARAVQDYVSDSVILNLVTNRQATSDPDYQPFSTNWIALHTESSAAPLGSRARYLLFLCVEPGEEPAKTVLGSMVQVHDSLSATDREILSQTAYLASAAFDPILRYVDGKPVFALRDYQGERLRWRCNAQPQVTTDVVNSAIARLLAAMYQNADTAVSWRTGLVVAIDNSRFFHGRTAMRRTSPKPRHLRRLRLLDRRVHS